MGPYLSRGPTPDGGYPADRDLHQMSDDGGPAGPDPARWSDPEWRDGGADDRTAVLPDPGTTAGRPSGVCAPDVRDRRRRWDGSPRGSSADRPEFTVVMSLRRSPVLMSVRGPGGLTSVWPAG